MASSSLHRRALLKSALLLAAASACGGAASAEPRPSSQAPEHGAAASLAAPQAAFAFALGREVAKDSANVVVSPASAALALSLVALFADEALTRSIFQVLGLQPQSGLQDLQALRDVAKARDNGPLSTAYALALDPSLAPSPDLRQSLGRAEVTLFEDGALNDDALGRINGWVAATTKNRIATLLEKIPDGAVLIALNALHFKDRWQKAFDPRETAPSPFKLTDGSSVETKLMHSGRRTGLFRADDRFIAAQLPFATERYALTLVTTKREPAPLQEFEPAASWLSGDSFVRGEGQVAFPPLALNSGANIKPALNALGLRDNGIVGFSGRPPSISEVVQRVDFAVNEEGAEAAAATAVIASRSADARFTNVVADRPFIFALRDVKTGLILVSGYIAKP